VADQLDFVLGALLFSLLVSPPSWQVALVVLVITPPIHLLTNFVAYHLGVKKEPW
jgi:CDP-2,3-bis-(O-geranylgeranyl)-sn-glycerol synthase